MTFWKVIGGRAIAIVRWDVSQFSECRRDAGSLSRLGGRAVSNN